ncbi:glyoxalase/bleomycin resistance/extradiol dioxygenase family protein [Paracoccus sp. CPCC 101403]|uniref:Glyoxalase/bleomycin resistance/extradiol dioxygenase family protein n=2 Tax=Paracoccus broussonetiae TaxID=3075834 RepID=A0ABU3EKD6_9RHOB|nr:VOC family protein [Paracoccus sp. CPCC 101403]MDT1064570.1 glyoxalase/bleomycin resistance/extradiol dioxygenase family protein [Paracoccus sp. CPCC 101403]
MRIEHVALWTRDLAGAAEFWCRHFGAAASSEYTSLNRPGFRSVFLSLPEGARIELMTGPWIVAAPPEAEGWAHVALALGSEQAVRDKAGDFAAMGLLLSGPRWTGDGYFEATIAAPDGTLIEITV